MYSEVGSISSKCWGQTAQKFARSSQCRVRARCCSVSSIRCQTLTHSPVWNMFFVFACLASWLAGLEAAKVCTKLLSMRTPACLKNPLQTEQPQCRTASGQICKYCEGAIYDVYPIEETGACFPAKMRLWPRYWGSMHINVERSLCPLMK